MRGLLHCVEDSKGKTIKYLSVVLLYDCIYKDTTKFLPFNQLQFDWWAVFVLIKTFVKMSPYHCKIAQRYNVRKVDGLGLNQMPKKAKP